MVNGNVSYIAKKPNMPRKIYVVEFDRRREK